ncbi:hypothetical protein F5884DRAFT_758200 [Xylogone sp. PMI_703]|nr:hypothetical protein F5884DRAFT_758200 [Xylogone sp. PMI_703]
MRINNISILRLLLVATTASLAQCKTTTKKEGFTFPKAVNASHPNVANLSVHSGDSLIVEYTPLPYLTTVTIDMNCYDSVEDAVKSRTTEGDVSSSFGALGPYNSTGRILWEFPLLSESSGYCQLILFNRSIASCSWGLFSVYSLVLDANANTPLFYSPVFKLSPNATREPTEWTGKKGAATSIDPTPLAPIVSITCPMGGIPPRDDPIFPVTIDHWPPLGDNVEFPI